MQATFKFKIGGIDTAFIMYSAVLILPIEAAGIAAYQHAHHSSEVERSDDAGGHTHHPSQGQHWTDVSEANGGEANKGVVVDCREDAGTGQNACFAGAGQFQRFKAAGLDVFQGTAVRTSWQPLALPAWIKTPAAPGISRLPWGTTDFCACRSTARGLRILSPTHHCWVAS